MVHKLLNLQKKLLRVCLDITYVAKTENLLLKVVETENLLLKIL